MGLRKLLSWRPTGTARPAARPRVPDSEGARYGGYLVVPLNNEGNRALVQEMVDARNVLWVPVSAEEFALLMPLFERFNQRFRLAIGTAAGEVLYLKDVVEALELAREFRGSAPDAATRAAAGKAVLAVQAMMDNGAYLEFAL